MRFEKNEVKKVEVLMKQVKVVFIVMVALLTQAVTAKAETWQQKLKSNFDIVETFDELQDWGANGLYPSGSGDPRAYNPALLPKKLDGSASIWGYWNNKFPTAIVGGVSNGPFVAGETVVNGKGAKWQYRKTHLLDGVTYLQLAYPVTGSVGSFQAGDTLIGQTSGATATISGWPKIIANHGANTWRSSGKSLMMNLGDNDNLDAMAGLGAQRLGTFFGDGISGKSGYKKLSLFMMVKLPPKFFGKSGSQSDIDYISVFKFLDICSGFTSINKFGSLADQQYIEKTPQTATEYGANQSIINLNGGGLSMAGRAATVEHIAVATVTPNSSPVTYYGKVRKSTYMHNNDPLYSSYGNDVNKIHPTLAGGEWFGLEIITDIGTPDNSDGTTELFVYDKNGTVKGHYRATGQLKLVKFDHYYNKIVLGGNRRTGSTSTYVDGRYWIDDFIVDGNRIGPTYFQLISDASDTTAPTAVITAPAQGATVSGTASVSVNATDNIAVKKLDLYVDGALKTSGTTGPLSWDTKGYVNGNHSLVVKAYDAAGNVGTSATVSVNVNNVADTTAPVVSIVSPANGASVSGTVNVSMNATDNVAVSKVELYVNGALYGVVGASPYSIGWNTSSLAAGSYTLQAKAYDVAGNMAQSGAVSVQIGGASDSIAPAVTGFTMPAAVNTLTAPISTFTASDNVKVTGYLVTQSSTRPLAGASGWSSTPPTSVTFSAAGVRTAYAWVKDAAGNVSPYRSATVIVDGTAPVITSFSPTGGTFYMGKQVRLSATATDAVALSHMRVSVDGTYKSTASGGSITYYWTPTFRGSHVFRFFAYDKAGNSSIKTAYITVK